MFVLSTIQGDVRVHPRDLNKPTPQAVTAVLEELYIDKVIPDLGLVTTLYDVQDIEGGSIYPNDGAAFFKAKFRLVVFRPFVKEVLLGKLTACDR
jgi:DNA-directed RNA polymerase III subunit RPC8